MKIKMAESGSLEVSEIAFGVDFNEALVNSINQFVKSLN